MSIEVHSLSYGFGGRSPSSIPCPTAKHEERRSRTYFSKPNVQYSPLLENGDIDMVEFLRGCHGVVDFVGFLGAAFSPVKNDISGNIAKFERVYETDPQRYATIKKLLDAELIDWPGRMGPGTEGLMYVKRALEFLCTFLELIVIDHKSGKRSNSLVHMGKEAYDRTLKKHHSKIERGLFKVVIHATPWRKDLLKTMAEGRAHAEDECIADIEQYLELMKGNVGRLVELYKELGFDK